MRNLNQLCLVIITLFIAVIGTQCLAKEQAPKPPAKIAQRALKKALDQNRDELLKVAEEVLSPLEYEVAFKSGTERAFRNRYWNQKEHGLYVDVVSGEPLFSSEHKFKSGTGWPSFDRSLDQAEVLEVPDHSHGMNRVEVRSKTSDIHLGHVFEDGPRKTTGRRFCINSASLRFVPLSEIKSEGYIDVIKEAGLVELYQSYLNGSLPRPSKKMSKKKASKGLIKRGTKVKKRGISASKK